MAATRDDFALQPSQEEQIQVRRPSQSVSVGTGRRQAPLPVPPKVASQPKVNAPLLPTYAAPPPPTSHSSQKTVTNPFVYENGSSNIFNQTDQHSDFGQAAPVLPPRATSPNLTSTTNGPPQLPSRLSQGRPQLPPRQSETPPPLPASNATNAPPSLSPYSTQGPPPIPSRLAEPVAPASAGAPPLPSRPRHSISGLPALPTPLYGTPPHSTVPFKLPSQTKGVAPPPLPPRQVVNSGLSSTPQSQQGPLRLPSPSYEPKFPLPRESPYAGGQPAPLSSQPPLHSQPASIIKPQALNFPSHQPTATGNSAPPPVPNRQVYVHAPIEPSLKQPAFTTQTTKTSKVSLFEQRVVELTNLERTKHGLLPLEWDSALGKVAREKSRDMSENKYFSHDSPTYGSLIALMYKFGVTYRCVCENLAYGQQTPEDVVIGWMQSPGHRKNILTSNITHIGVGYVVEGHYWTQQFIQKQEEEIPPPNTAPVSVDDYEQKVIELTNQERAKHRLAPLKWDIELGKVAREKSRDMSEHKEMSHDSPVYGSMVELMKRFGIKYRCVCENIACGQQTPEDVVISWMQSPGHRKNILTPNLTHIGVGFELEGHYWTQEFVQK
jgi:uncharacterized YkwD family protein